MRTFAVLFAASCIVSAERLTLRVTADTTVTFADQRSKRETPRGVESQRVLQDRANNVVVYEKP